MIGILGVTDTQVAAAILGWLGWAMFWGTVLAGATWLILRVTKGRVGSAVQTAFWAIVLIKFLAPIGPSWSLSMAGLAGRVSSLPVSGLRAVDPSDIGPGDSVSATSGAIAPASVVTSQPNRWPVWLAGVYAACVLTVGVVRIQSYRTFRARCERLPEAEPEVRRLVRDVCVRLEVGSVPAVRVSTAFASPFVMGMVRPLLILSHRQLLRPNELETVLVHEITHLRRGDVLVRGLQWLAGTLLFFWPVVAWVNRRIDAVREQTCDESALRHGKLSAAEYARCLIGALQSPAAARVVYQPAFMAANRKTLERRIDMILESGGGRTGRPMWALVAVVVLLAWGGFALAGPGHTKKKMKSKDPGIQQQEQELQDRTLEVIDRISSYSTADADGSGKTSRPERTAFVMAVVKQFPDQVLTAYPYGDLNADGALDFKETYSLVRGHTRHGMDQKRIKEEYKTAEAAGASEEELHQIKKSGTEAYFLASHEVLDMIEWLLDEMPAEPPADAVAATHSAMAPLEAEQEKQEKAKSIKSKVYELEETASKLRAKADKVGGAKGEQLEAKAAEFEKKAQQLREKLANWDAGKEY